MTNLTPEQFNTLATKEEMTKLDKKVDRVIIDQLATKESLQTIKENMATKDDINQVLAAVDTVMKGYQEVKTEQTANIAAHDRFQAEITKLKVHTGLAA